MAEIETSIAYFCDFVCVDFSFIEVPDSFA